MPHDNSIIAYIWTISLGTLDQDAFSRQGVYPACDGGVNMVYPAIWWSVGPGNSNGSNQYLKTQLVSRLSSNVFVGVDFEPHELES
jgi:hypothetical protein